MVDETDLEHIPGGQLQARAPVQSGAAFAMTNRSRTPCAETKTGGSRNSSATGVGVPATGVVSPHELNPASTSRVARVAAHLGCADAFLF